MSAAVLLIEDDPRLAEMVQAYLGGAGFSVAIAASGAAGLALGWAWWQSKHESAEVRQMDEEMHKEEHDAAAAKTGSGA